MPENYFIKDIPNSGQPEDIERYNNLRTTIYDHKELNKYEEIRFQQVVFPKYSDHNLKFTPLN